MERLDTLAQNHRIEVDVEQGKEIKAPPMASPAESDATPREHGRGILRTIAKVVVPLIVVAVALYWLRFAPVSVTAFTAGPGVITAEVMGTGTLEARVSSTISPKISGLIAEMLVDQGDRVAEGEALFRLADADLKQQVEMAENTLIAARVAVEGQTAAIQRAHAVLELARIERQRVEELMQTETAAAIELDRVVQSLRIAEAETQSAEASFSEAKAQVLVAEKTLAFQQARLADTVVTAPCAGLIARRDREPGDVVVPGASVLLLLNTDEMWINAWVDETEMARLQPGQPARIAFRSEPTGNYSGRVVRLGREADRETREFIVDVLAEQLPENWAVGQRADVYIETARAENVLSVPTRAIVWHGDQPGGYVESEGRAVWRALELGLRGVERVEVRGGVSAGARLVIPVEATRPTLRDGQRVVVR